MGKSAAVKEANNKYYTKGFSDIEVILERLGRETGESKQQVRARLSFGVEKRGKERKGTAWQEYLHEQTEAWKSDPDDHDSPPPGKGKFIGWISARCQEPYSLLEDEDLAALVLRRVARLGLEEANPHQLALKTQNRRQEKVIEDVQKSLAHAFRESGLESIFVAVNPSSGQSFGGASGGSRKGDSFITVSLGVPVVDFIKKFEAFSTVNRAGDGTPALSLLYKNRELAQKTIVTFILDGLSENVPINTLPCFTADKSFQQLSHYHWQQRGQDGVQQVHEDVRAFRCRASGLAYGLGGWQAGSGFQESVFDQDHYRASNPAGSVQ
ncbi:hypothetical protein P7C70_g8153, partial [Phenoliferia sp. Uapishka_3]